MKASRVEGWEDVELDVVFQDRGMGILPMTCWIETGISAHTGGTPMPLWPESAHLTSFEVGMSEITNR